jgi:hypothetical protein
MTEAEWLGCTDPFAMLDDLRGRGAASPRKQRLFAAACCRRLWNLLHDKRCRRAVRKLEDAADNAAHRRTLADAYNLANAAYLDVRRTGTEVESRAACTVVCAAHDDIVSNLFGNFESALELAEGLALPVVRRLESDLLRDIFGNSFRPVAVDPSWLTPAVTSLARGIYDERAPGRMPALADALERAGCDNADVSGHCRDGGEHARGCWVVDLALGKR